MVRHDTVITMPEFNTKGFAHIFLLIILFIGIIAGVFLVQHPQIFKPKALEENSFQLGGMRYFENKVGWAYTAIPGVSRDQMIKDMARMKDLGANIVYIGHANPGDVILSGPEPGLSPAVYFALRDNSAKAADASLIYQAIIDSLEASKNVGLNVVLPIGYQIQMGADWNAKNPDSLRLDNTGNNLDFWGSGPTASPYSPIYQRDIKDYYRWVNQEIVSKYPNVVAINLGDEPMGSDFSHWAKEEFTRRYNSGFDNAPQEQRGQFLSEVIADHAALSANMWKEINPSVWTMITFHIQREQPWVPNMETLFNKTPNTFVVSADTHLHDALPNLPLTESDSEHLYGMVRTLSYLSKVYNKKLMIWTSANAWGLTNQGGIKEAEKNLAIIDKAIGQGGGKVAMLMAWGWNIQDQGVYRCGNQCAFDSEEMINSVSSKLALMRDSLSIQTGNTPGKVIYLPSSILNTKIGEENIDHLANAYIDLQRFNLSEENIIYLTDGFALDQAKNSGATIIDASF